MVFNFKKFEKQHGRFEERITITKSNSIGFPTGFYQKNKINEYKYVVLYWDDSAAAIGVQFTNDENEKSKFSIIHSKKGYGGSVVARSFFGLNDIDTQKYADRYKWQKNNIENIGEIYVIELKERENAQ